MFPSIYHAHHSLHSEDLNFWLDMVALSGEPILELGCGTGRVTIPIAIAGYKIYGMDKSPVMLSYLIKRIPSGFSNVIHLLQGDFTCFHLAKKFNTILLPCNTLSTLKEQARMSLFNCIGRHSLVGGIFAASVVNPQLLRSLHSQGKSEVEEVFLDPADNNPVQVSSSWKRTRSSFVVHWFYDRLRPDGSVQRLDVQVKHYITDIQVYFDELAQAGLKKVGAYGDFDKSDFNPASPYCILIASK